MKLNEIVPWGRGLEEYTLMFSLSAADLHSKILGCGDGPASFNAEMTKLGYFVVSVDPIYQFSAEQIEQRVQAVYEPIISQVRQDPDRFIWRNFRDSEELGLARLSAMRQFIEDFDLGKQAGRYLAQSLPVLDFTPNQFDLCVCSHLLFLYSEQLSLEFHLASIYELLRVASEIRIFPLLTLDGDRSPYIEPVIRELDSQGFRAEIQSVAYEFQKGGNQMLKITHSIR